MKICTKCKKKKVANDFYINRQKLDHKSSACKSCLREWHKNYVKTEKYRKYTEEYTSSEKHKKWLKEYTGSEKHKEYRKAYTTTEKYRKRRKELKEVAEHLCTMKGPLERTSEH